MGYLKVPVMGHYTHFDIISGIFALNYSAHLSLFFPLLCDITSQMIEFFSEFILRIDMLPEKNFAHLNMLFQANI